MIYFFVKGGAFVQCEVQPGRPHTLTVMGPGGGIETHTHISSESLIDHWAEVCVKLDRDGWSGPFGRDPRD